MIQCLRIGIMKRTKLSKNIYDESIIRQAIRDYGSIANIQLKSDSTYYDLQFENCKYDENRTLKEFENYLIDLMNVRGSK